MKSKAYILEDPTTGFLWLHNESMDESYRVKTFERTLDLAKFREIKAELVSLQGFGLCMASYDLLTVKNKENLYSVLAPFEDTMGYGAIYASICEGFTIKSAYGFGLRGDDYVIAENVEGKWGMIKISRAGNIWYEYSGGSFSIPETVVPFEYDDKADVLRESENTLPIMSSLNTDQLLVDLTIPENRDIKEIGACLSIIMAVREGGKWRTEIAQLEKDNASDKTIITPNYTREDSAEFGQKVRRKIDGWYSKEKDYTTAVDRIVRQREKIISLLESMKKVDTKKLISYLDKSGFFYRPSSPNKHHNYPGGLAEHSFGVFQIVEEWNNMTSDERRNSELYHFNLSDKPVSCNIFTEKMNYDDMVIATLCHDLCKAEHYYFEGRIIKGHNSDPELRSAHSALSVKRLQAAGIDTPECEELLLAVLTHMRLFSPAKSNRDAQNQQKARGSMLAIAVWAADKLDASRHPAGRLHRDR